MRIASDATGSGSKIAFLVAAHKHADQVADLVSTLDLARNYCVIHCDSKSGADFEAGLRQRLAQGAPSHVRFLPRRSVVWGGSGLLAVTLDAMRALSTWASDWSHFVNLSGQCLPTRPVSELAAFLSIHPCSNFMECVDLKTEFPQGWHWVRFRRMEMAGRLLATPIPMRLAPGVRYYKGASWVILSRAFCDHVVADATAQRILSYFGHTKAPEEMALHTVLMNSPFRETLMQDYKRLIVWASSGAPHPNILSLQDMPKIAADGHFFARKFDAGTDRAVIDALLARLRTGTAA